MTTFRQFVEEKIPMGLCFSFAFKKARELLNNDNAVIVHGTITQPYSIPPEENRHAWVEINGKVYDWQCMEGGCGGNYMGKGYPKSIFYELYKPKDMKRYTPEEAVIKAIKSGHHGPWD